MGKRVYKQPDGQLAIFSTVTGTWIVSDATPEEIIEEFVAQAAHDARREASRVVDHVLADEPEKAYGRPLRTFAEADRDSVDNDGISLLKELKEE